MLALSARVVGLADYVTTDEANHWVGRVERFNAAVASHQWVGTIQTGHPGVPTMVFGGIGLALEQRLVAWGWISTPSPVAYLAWLRLPSAVFEALCVPLAYVLLRRLVGGRIALIAAVLWATSPYLIAHSRLLHVDALLTAFITLSILHLLLACRTARPRWHILASGIFAGLALLTKGPALILLPIAGLLMLWQIAATSLTERLGRTIGWYLVWLGVAAVVIALWPAVWVAPGHVFYKYTDEILSNGGRPNGSGQFFLGRAVGDPGPLFYPVADLFRLTPLATLGLLLLPVALWRERRQRNALLALAAMIVFWTLVMTVGQKKFDRYVLPTWPALLVLAAAGLAQVWIGGREQDGPHPAPRGYPLSGAARGEEALTPRPSPAAAGEGELYTPLARRNGRGVGGEGLPRLLWNTLVTLVFIAGALQPVIQAHPYYLSYYNPLMGGGPGAQRALLIGWGEGMDQVGAYLRQRSDITYGPVLSALQETLQPFVPVPVKDVTELGQGPANYAVVYLESIQRAAHPDIYSKIQQTVPLHQVMINGIAYATIYQLPKPFAQPVDAQWGDALHLRGVTIDHAPGVLTVTPSWDVRATLAAPEFVFMHLLDADGNVVARLDVPPGGGDYPPTNAWQPGQQIAVPLPLSIPSSVAAGKYQLVMGVYDSVGGARLPLQRGSAADPAHAGPDALTLGTIDWP